MPVEMIHCPGCGNTVPRLGNRCPRCGTPYPTQSAEPARPATPTSSATPQRPTPPQPSQSVQPTPATPQPQQLPMPPRGNNTTTLLIVIIVLLIIIIVGLLGFFYGKSYHAMEPTAVDSVMVDSVVADTVVADEELAAEPDAAIKQESIRDHYDSTDGKPDTAGVPVDMDMLMKGGFIDENGYFPVELRFHPIGDGQFSCIYKNVALGGKIRMIGEITDNGYLFRGQDGNSSFTIVINNQGGETYRGTATVGTKTLNVELTAHYL